MKIRKKLKIIGLSLSSILFLSMILPSLSRDKFQEVEAANRLQGIQKIVTNLSEKNKYTILEIVPDESYASIGYYISGYEAELDEKIIASTLKYEVTETELSAAVSGYEARKNIALTAYTSLKDSVVQYNEAYLYEEDIHFSEDVSDWNVIIAPEGKTFKDVRVGRYISIGADSTIKGNYTFDEETSIYTYTPGMGTYEWEDNVAIGTAQIVEFKSLYYNTTVTSNDWFAKRVLEIGAAIGTESSGPVQSHNIEVITVTPTELEERLNSSSTDAIALKDIDMVYLSNSSCLTLPSTGISYTSYDARISYGEPVNDIAWETAYNIFDYAVNLNLPVIVDDSIIPSPALDTTVSVISANNNVVRLAYLLKNYTETYTGAGGVGFNYTFENYKDANNASYVIPSVLPGENVAAGQETRQEADTKIGSVLAQSYANYVKYETKVSAMKSLVYANVYVNKSGKNLVHSTFSSDIETISVNSVSSNKVYGIAKVVDEIYTENFHYHVQSKDFTTDYVDSTTNPSVKVSQATLVKYILNFQSRRIELYKDKIKVLDIEPTKYSKLTEATVRNWISGTIESSKIKEIEIVQTTSTEFIGKIEDLNKEYDLIYIGSCIGSNSLAGSIVQTSAGVANYNDQALDGKIYTHVGDTVDITKRAGGLLKDEYSTNKLENNRITTRYAGNDITKDKVAALTEFVRAGYPVVISSTFYTDNTINKERVDENSYMYEFMSTCVNSKNVLKEVNGLITGLPSYINMPKLNLSMIAQPDEYAITEVNNSISTVNYLQPLGDRNVLIYSFEVTNTLEGNSAANDYKVQLYVDINADGQFDTNEELDSLEVMNSITMATVPHNQLKQNTRYTVSRELPDDYVGIIPWQLKITMLEKDSTNKVVETSVRTTAEGYTAVKAKEKIKVRVLQIASLQMTYQDGRNTYYTGLALPHVSVLDDPNITEDNIVTSQLRATKFDGLFSDLETHMGFDIDVDIISVKGYVKRYENYVTNFVTTNLNKYIEEYKKNNSNATEATANTEGRKLAEAAAVEDFYKTFYKDYDMIIMGFEDCYQDIANAGSVEAIDMFIKSGRSVLFAHDTTSYFNVNREVYANSSGTAFSSTDPWYHWGYYLNQYIRSDVGMDRYGITEDSLSILKNGVDLKSTDLTWSNYIATATSLDKEIPYHAGTKNSTAHEVHGFSDGLIDDYPNMETKTNSETYVFGSAGKSTSSQSITQVNQGQITTYPYDINIDATESLRTDVSGNLKMMNLPTMPIATTHAQYYQLDMNIDKDNDNKSDMVVWYCLSGNRNSSFPNDVRNNYYIYSVGNVTYTGMGHYQNSTSANGLSDAEAKLFVNTIVASFNSGKKDPGINIISDNTNKNSSLSYVYRTHDRDNDIVEDGDVVLNYYATDMNIVNGTKEILIKYYYEIPQALYDANVDITTKAADGSTIYLRTLPGTGQSEVIASNGVIYQITLSSAFVNQKMMNDGDNDTANTIPFKVYIGAQTRINSSQNANEYTYTSQVLDYVTFRERNLFNLE